MNIDEMTFIDLFAGIGGFRIALESFGAKCVFSSEIDKHCKSTYFDNFQETPHGDITKIDVDDIPDHDILCAGFPCQPFSISGKQLGFEDTRGTLFFDIARIVEKKMPKILFLENVANLARHNDSKTVEHMIEVLEKLNYSVHLKMLNASDFGVPQNRKRIYFVAFRNDLEVFNFQFPEPKKIDITVSDILVPKEEVPDYALIDRVVKYTKDDPQDRSNKTVRIGTINKGGQGDRVYSVNGVGITLSAQGGGAGAKTGGYLVDGVVRKLTPRECARMQGFPEDFIINKLYGQAYKQFGNSVAIPVLKSIISEIKNAIQ